MMIGIVNIRVINRFNLNGVINVVVIFVVIMVELIGSCWCSGLDNS